MFLIHKILCILKLTLYSDFSCPFSQIGLLTVATVNSKTRQKSRLLCTELIKTRIISKVSSHEMGDNMAPINLDLNRTWGSVEMRHFDWMTLHNLRPTVFYFQILFWLHRPNYYLRYLHGLFISYGGVMVILFISLPPWLSGQY